MSSNSFIKPNEFDSNNIQYSDIKPMGPNGKQIYLNYNGGRLAFHAPKMRIPFGANKYQEDG